MRRRLRALIAASQIATARAALALAVRATTAAQHRHGMAVAALTSTRRQATNTKSFAMVACVKPLDDKRDLKGLGRPLWRPFFCPSLKKMARAIPPETPSRP